MEATETTAPAIGRRGRSDDPPEHRMNDGAGGKYRPGSSETEESADKSTKWGGRGEGGVGVRGGGIDRYGGRGGRKAADSDGGGHGRKRRGGHTRGRSGRRGRHRRSHLRGRQRGRSRRPPWGENRGKGEGFRPAGKPRRRALCSGRQRGRPRGLWSGDQSLRSEGRQRRPRGLWSDRKPRGGLPGSGREIPVAAGH